MPATRSRPGSRARRLAAAAAVVALWSLVAAPEGRAATAFTLGATAAPLGMATDRPRERYWVLSSSTGRLTLNAFKADGTVEGKMSSRDTVTNVQALAYVDGEAWVGDVGGSRSQVSIWQVIEPWPGTEINHAPQFKLSYPDGAHDAAAILVDANHRLSVVTKGPKAAIYTAPVNPSATEVNKLVKGATVLDGVTDAVVLVDGRIALRTAARVVVLDATSFAVLGEAEVGVNQRGWSLAQGIAETDLLAGATASGEVAALAVPGPAPVEPTAKSTIPPETQMQAADPEDTRTFEQTGTTFAVVAAIVLSALAAIVVTLKR